MKSDHETMRGRCAVPATERRRRKKQAHKCVFLLACGVTTHPATPHDGAECVRRSLERATSGACVGMLLELISAPPVPTLDFCKGGSSSSSAAAPRVVVVSTTAASAVSPWHPAARASASTSSAHIAWYISAASCPTRKRRNSSWSRAEARR